MAPVFQPVGQKRLTNIAVVRLKKAGNRFEIACYKNKVGDWRTGVEKDLDEVLQTMTIFSNVGKGVVSKEKELQEAFGTTDEKTICLEILAKGELQVSDKERKIELEHLFKDVAGLLVDRCVNPETSRPYTLTMLERALRDVHFNPDPKKSAKQQALEALPLLKAKLPIERARMRLRLTCPVDCQKEVLDHMASHNAIVEATDEAAGSAYFTVQVEPGVFRELHGFMQNTTGGQGRVEVMSMTVMAEAVTADEFQMDLGSSGRVAAMAPAPPPLLVSTPAAARARMAERERGQQQQQQEGAAAASSSGSRGGAVSASGASGSGGDVVYPRGPIEGLPEAHASRKERFAELDTLQPGWQVELRTKGDTVEAIFYSPTGEKVGAYANARRMALQARKAAAVKAMDEAAAA